MNKLQSLEECMKRIEKKAINEKHARLERHIATLERKLKPTNEIAPAVTASMRLLVKSLPKLLPVILSELTSSKSSSDDNKDNKDKYELIKTFVDAGVKLVNMFSDNK